MFLKFTLEGKNAFFKNPEVNSSVYFTYNNIHKVALMGIIGATIGLKGYNQSQKGELPEFYQKLKDIQVAICPNKKIFEKKILTTTNTTGYASSEQGGVLIIKEQILENVSWDIYIEIDRKELEIFKDYLLEGKTEYVPYLGKNEYIAEIKDVEVIKNNEINKNIGLVEIDSLTPITEKVNDCTYRYTEFLPIELNEETKLYNSKNLQFTDGNVNCEYVSVSNKNLVFI